MNLRKEDSEFISFPKVLVRAAIGNGLQSLPDEPEMTTRVDLAGIVIL